jgi:hypothetical protein
MRNAPAYASLVLGLLATAALPVAVAYVYSSSRVQLIYGAVGIPVALVLGLAAIEVARRGRLRAERTVARRGAGASRLGRLLGVLALLLAGTGLISLAVYGILTWRSRG